MPTTTPKPVKTSEKAEDMLRFDLDNENDTIRNYRERVRQCEALGEYAMAEHIREILVHEQDHQIDLATALGIDAPDPGKPAQAGRRRSSRACWGYLVVGAGFILAGVMHFVLPAPYVSIMPPALPAPGARLPQRRRRDRRRHRHADPGDPAGGRDLAHPAPARDRARERSRCCIGLASENSPRGRKRSRGSACRCRPC